MRRIRTARAWLVGRLCRSLVGSFFWRVLLVQFSDSKKCLVSHFEYFFPILAASISSSGISRAAIAVMRRSTRTWSAIWIDSVSTIGAWLCIWLGLRGSKSFHLLGQVKSHSGKPGTQRERLRLQREPKAFGRETFSNYPFLSGRRRKPEPNPNKLRVLRLADD